jgi:hypothetical protein
MEQRNDHPPQSRRGRGFRLGSFRRSRISHGFLLLFLIRVLVPGEKLHGYLYQPFAALPR